MSSAASKADAEKRAQALCDELGPGWTPRVWENLGWCYNAVAPYIQVCPSGDSYFALISDRIGSAGGLSIWTPEHHTSKDPREAVRIALKAAVECVDGLLEAVHSVDDTCDDSKIGSILKSEQWEHLSK